MPETPGASSQSQQVPPSQQQPAQQQPGKQSNKGCCLGLGCLALLLVLVVIFVAAIGYGYFRVRSFATASSPRQVEQPELTPRQRREAAATFESLRTAVDTGSPASITLSSSDINAFIAEHAQPAIADGIGVALKEDRVIVDFSVPLEKIPTLGGRYLNGTATLAVSGGNGKLNIHAQELSLKGEKLSDTWMKELRKRNLADELNQQPDTRDLLQRISSITVREGRVHIDVKSATTPGNTGERNPQP